MTLTSHVTVPAGQPFDFSRRSSSASTASRMNCPRLFGPISASMRDMTASESRTVVSFTPSEGLPIRRVVSDSCKSDKPIAFMLTDITDSQYITTIGYGDKQMATTYRADWIDPADPHRNTVGVSHHGDDLKAARASARKMSKATGSAYVIRTTNGLDDGQIGYTDGRSTSRTWEV